MAVPTTIAFILTAVAILCARPATGLMAVVTSDTAGGVAARRLLPAAIGLPLVLVWLMAIGENAGLYGQEVGIWLLVLVSVVGFVLLVWLTVKPLERADKKLKAAAAELERSNTELESFAYVASHDLKQPLRRIASYIKLLSEGYKGKMDSEAEEFMGYAEDGANRMQGLIDDLLAYARVSNTENPLKPSESEDICDQALDNLKIAIGEREAKIGHGKLPRVMADATQLEQLFQNLIGNAIKFNDNELPRVRVDAERSSGQWVFSVHDNGIGIEPEYRERVFESFKRLTTREQYAGTGLGLAICKKIVERHGGKIWLDSKPGEGSTFYFTMPLAKEESNGTSRHHAIGRRFKHA